MASFVALLYSVWLRICYAFQAALRAVGAAGGGWALVAALRAMEGRAPSQRPRKGGEASAESLVVPRHVAVIMDGNRRFGRQKYGDSLSGHRNSAMMANFQLIK